MVTTKKGRCHCPLGLPSCPLQERSLPDIRLFPLAEELLPESQYGFRLERSRDNWHGFFSACLLQEKCREQHRHLYTAVFDFIMAQWSQPCYMNNWIENGWIGFRFAKLIWLPWGYQEVRWPIQFLYHFQDGGQFQVVYVCHSHVSEAITLNLLDRISSNLSWRLVTMALTHLGTLTVVWPFVTLTPFRGLERSSNNSCEVFAIITYLWPLIFAMTQWSPILLLDW